MTTYFFHDPYGATYSQIMHNGAPLWDPYGVGSSGTVSYSFGANFVPGHIDEGKYEPDDGYYSDSSQNMMLIDHAGNEVLSVVPALAAGHGQLTGDRHQYPNPELIRHFHTLHTLLPHIQPERLQNATFGPTLDIVEEHSGHIFAFAVPKKMLVLFCGRKVISRFLRTLEREENESSESGHLVQVLQFPRSYTNHIGVKIVINWMHLACHRKPSDMRPVHLPKTLFAAISLSRALTAFGLHRDASRVDHFISVRLFARHLDLDEVVAIWRCLPKDSKYTYRMIEELRKQLQYYMNSEDKAHPDLEQFWEFLEQTPELKARVEDKDYNNCDEYRPFFGTEWCLEAAKMTQKMLGGKAGTGNNTFTTPKTAEKGPITSGSVGHDRRGFWEASQGRKYKKTRAQSQDTIAFRDWKPQSHPTAWPEFNKTVVLNIAQAETPTSERTKPDDKSTEI